MSEIDHSMRGWRGRIGFLWPHDGLNDDEFWAYLPDGVALLTARFSTESRETSLGLDELAAYAEIEPLERTVKLLEATRPHVYALGDHAGSFVGGPGRDLEQCAAMSRVGGVPATTMSTALVAALETMEIRIVSLALPYTAEVNERCVSFLEGHGIRIVKVCSAALDNECAIGLSPPERWYALGREADHPEAEAIVLGGGGIRAAAILDRLEADTGKSAVGGPGALIWHAARLMNVNATRPDRGRLFAHHGDSSLRAPPGASEQR